VLLVPLVDLASFICCFLLFNGQLRCTILQLLPYVLPWFLAKLYSLCGYASRLWSGDLCGRPARL